jgi:outer membrane immunogenic protein
MKNICIGIAALATLIAAPAFAADMPLKAPPAPVAPALSWTGFYIGLNGGYGWNRSTGDTTCITPGGVVNGLGCPLPNTGIVRPQGGLFGGQIGYNWQSSAIVWGLETDIQWANIKASGAKTDFCCGPPFPAAGVDAASADLQWFGTFRGRVGVLATPSALLYVTGGLIYGHESVAGLVSFPLVQYPSAASSTRAGGTAGAGFEYAFTPNFSGKVEGLWYDMGSLNTAFTSPVTGFTEQFHFRFTGAIVRGGLNWKFNTAYTP